MENEDLEQMVVCGYPSTFRTLLSDVGWNWSEEDLVSALPDSLLSVIQIAQSKFTSFNLQNS